jgi:hypothetical protein
MTDAMRHYMVDTDTEAGPPASACGEWGASTSVEAEVSCPECLIRLAL